MKLMNAAFILVGALIFACNKKDVVSLSATVQPIRIEANMEIPLNDLGTGTYKDSMGGLYPGGANEPSGDYANYLMRAAKNTLPIDTFGNPAPEAGKIVFISMGGSTGGRNMKALIDKTVNNPKTNPKLMLISCNSGAGQASLSSIINTNSTYWEHVRRTLTGKGSGYRQVQVLYLETDDSISTMKFPNRPNLVRNQLKSSLRVLKQQFPNMKIVYVLGRTRTFGNVSPWNREPSPYYFGWGCKWAIQDQINGAPGTEYRGKDAVAPMITWGFYEWADSLPRLTDQFYWRSTETTDGLHATEAGQDTLSTRFQRFLLTDRIAKQWYAAP